MFEAGREFFAEGNLPGGFRPEAFTQNWTKMIYAGHGMILGAFKNGAFIGALGAVFSPDPSNGDKIATEAFWYVRPGHRGPGLRLLKAFEEIAMKRGVKRIGMVHLLSIQPEGMANLYQRLGYRPVEVNFLKELSA